MQSIENGGIGAATYGVLLGTKIAVKAGIWKFGFASLLKAAALSTVSIGALPVVVSVGAASYVYKNYKK